MPATTRRPSPEESVLWTRQPCRTSRQSRAHSSFSLSLFPSFFCQCQRLGIVCGGACFKRGADYGADFICGQWRSANVTRHPISITTILTETHTNTAGWCVWPRSLCALCHALCHPFSSPVPLLFSGPLVMRPMTGWRPQQSAAYAHAHTHAHTPQSVRRRLPLASHSRRRAVCSVYTEARLCTVLRVPYGNDTKTHTTCI